MTPVLRYFKNSYRKKNKHRYPVWTGIPPSTRADHFCNVFVYILHEKPHMYTYWEFILYNCLITSMRTYVFLQLSPFLPLTSLFSLHFHPTIPPSHPSLSIQELLHDKSISVCVNVTPVCSPRYTKLGSAGPIMTFPVQSITQRPL